jgi:hypothetical protein
VRAERIVDSLRVEKLGAMRFFAVVGAIRRLRPRIWKA